jgi:hypothetical protein
MTRAVPDRDCVSSVTSVKANCLGGDEGVAARYDPKGFIFSPAGYRPERPQEPMK